MPLVTNRNLISGNSVSVKWFLSSAGMQLSEFFSVLSTTSLSIMQYSSAFMHLVLVFATFLFAHSYSTRVPRFANSQHTISTEHTASGCKMIHGPIQNDLIIRAARGEKVERTPVWIFRQAGRHLPEYNAYKAAKGKNFLQLLTDPADVAEVTMQPVRRYNVDAAILFSDILVVLQALGFEVSIPGGTGITVPKPITSVADYYARMPAGSIDVAIELSHVIEAVALIKEQLQGKVPLIGFSAAPWTLMYYLLGGTSKKNQHVASMWLREHPVESKQLLDVLATVIIDYLSAQINAGADLIQVFEAMGEHISEADFCAWALPCLTRIATELKQRHPTVPLMVFPRCATYSLEALQTAGYDVVTMDTHTDRSTIRARLQAEVAAQASKSRAGPAGSKNTLRAASIQGNFDVTFLRRSSTTAPACSRDRDVVYRETRRMLEQLGPQGLIANLGEGLSGQEDPELVNVFVDAVHEISEHLIK